MQRLFTTIVYHLVSLLYYPRGQAPWLTHIWTRIAIMSVSLAYSSIINRLLSLGIHIMYTGAKIVSIVFI